MDRVPVVFDILFLVALVCLFLSTIFKWTLDNFEFKDDSRKTLRIVQLIFLVAFWVLLIGTIVSFNIMFKGVMPYGVCIWLNPLFEWYITVQEEDFFGLKRFLYFNILNV